MTSLDELRQTLNEVDSQLMRLVRKRQEIALQIGRVKRDSGRPTRDWQREREVLERVSKLGQDIGLPDGLAQRILQQIIQASLQVQEHDRVRSRAAGDGSTCLIIGGAGQMGQWFARFLDSQGYEVTIADLAENNGVYPYIGDWENHPLNYDLILVCTSLGRTSGVLSKLATLRPKGLVVEIASLKTPLRDALRELTDAGVRVASIHPMFGPSTELLSGRHVVCVDLGTQSAHHEGQALFDSTMARCMTMSLDEHDRVIAQVLGLSHAVNIAFFTALARCGANVPQLNEISSTTFDEQLKVSAAVSKESPQLYYDIQTQNEYGLAALTELEAAIRDLRNAVATEDAKAFQTLMTRGRSFLDTRAHSTTP